jgi:quercetin dioxygenase-like cupin family protein
MNQKWFAFDYVVGALTPAERAQMKLRAQYDRALAADIECIESVMSPLALAPDDVEVPSGLWDRIEANIAEQVAEDPAMITEAFEDGVWVAWDDGIDVKPLWDKVSFLVRCAPGAIIAPHRHDLDERMLVVSGSIRVGSRLLGVGDCQFSPEGTSHGEILSASGCTLLIQRVAKAA